MTAANEARWQARLLRERQARKEAERLLEAKSLELYRANGELRRAADVLEQQVRERTAELLEALQQAEAATRAKSDFLAMMSHEIRTPLNAMLGMAELLSLSTLDDDQAEDLATLRSSGESLLSLINDLLDYSKIEAGRLELDDVPFDLRAELRDTIALYRPLATQRQLQLDLILADDLPAQVQGDSARLRQILSNLLSNALKFTHSGGIEVRAALLVAAGSGQRLRLEVRDTGIGIPMRHIPRLFRAFTQVDASINRRYGGTGLGLAICGRLAEAMGGHISVTSEEGLGSCFVLELPLKGVAPSLPPAAEVADTGLHPVVGMERLVVLVVDDHVVNLKLALAMLARLGVTADAVTDGSQALQAVQERAYDLVLMDVQMPVLDGLQAARAMRALPLARQPKIVALTAAAFESDRRNCLDAGMDDFLAKPLRLSTLRSLLRQLLPPF
ncbi:MAG: hypothetical protein RL026_2704 [Pseudomonadota bacterium]|jgi:signal transduction histidine kinase/CheY-like chemotaxis protein